MDASARFQFLKHLTADADFNFAYARVKNKTIENRIPLAPIITSIGGISYNKNNFIASLRYRHLGARPANEINSIVADGYTLLDGVASYTFKKFTLGLSVENIANSTWREAQFETETKLKTEAEPVSEIHFTSGTPRNVKVTLAFKF